MNLHDSESAFTTGGTLATLVIMAFLLERALALVFDHDWFRKIPECSRYKPIIAFAVSWIVCWFYSFDVLAALLEPEGVTWVGTLITAGILAGGSAAAVQLVQQILGFSRENRENKANLKKLQMEAAASELKAKIAGTQKVTQVIETAAVAESR